jgi:glutaminyl-peptide cyclotransferase
MPFPPASIARAPGMPVFDAQQAWTYLKKQCDFGPRAPGTEAHEKCLQYLKSELEKSASSVRLEKFTYVDRRRIGQSYAGTNIVAAFNPGLTRRVLLCAHWDTRPWADKDPNPDNHVKPILGANDGASGVAVLLEMARLMRQTSPSLGVDIVFFDLEDIGDYDAEDDPLHRNAWCAGSAHFVGVNPDYRPIFGILLDMVGDKDLHILKEGFSQEYAAGVVALVWDAARRAGVRSFGGDMNQNIADDHLTFLQQGIPVIDLIDYDYPPWHTLADTPEQCSAQSLGDVGNVLVEVLYGK